MELPETPIVPGQEDESLRKHVGKMRAWAVWRRMQSLVEEVRTEERARRRLAKIIVVTCFAALGTFAMMAFVASFYR